MVEQKDPNLSSETGKLINKEVLKAYKPDVKKQNKLYDYHSYYTGQRDTFN